MGVDEYICVVLVEPNGDCMLFDDVTLSYINLFLTIEKKNKIFTV